VISIEAKSMQVFAIKSNQMYNQEIMVGLELSSAGIVTFIINF
jgi:hypothetical protein